MFNKLLGEWMANLQADALEKIFSHVSWHLYEQSDVNGEDK